jgi:mRNA interferase MazF
MARRYVPDTGDVVWINFNPQAGREQAGYRPAVVLSPSIYNEKSGLMICCPISSQIRGYSFEVQISGQTRGVVLADHLKSMDWPVRGAKPKGKISGAELAEIRGKLRTLLG